MIQDIEDEGARMMYEGDLIELGHGPLLLGQGQVFLLCFPFSFP